MGAITINPGDSALVRVSGDGEQPMFVQLTYEELQSLVRKGYKRQAKTKSSASRASRTVCLLARAIETGKWSTGAPVDPAEMYDRLVELLNEISDDDYGKLSQKARDAISSLMTSYRNNQDLIDVVNSRGR